MKKILYFANLMLIMSGTFFQTNAQETIYFVTPYDDLGPHDLYNREVENIEFLKNQGFTVIPFWAPNMLGAVGQDTIDVLNAADLVIIGRAGQSVNFKEDIDREAWNSLTSPQLLINMWIARSSRLQWFNSEACGHEDYDPSIIYATILEPDDTIFSGVTLLGDSLDWHAPPPHDFIRLDSSTNGEILATWDNNAILIARFDEGVPFYEGSVETSETPAGPRSFIGMGNNHIADVYNFFPLTINAKAVYLAEIYRMLGQPVKAPLFGPTDINLSNSLLIHNNPAGSFIGEFETSDLTASDSHQYTFASGEGDTDNASFQIRDDSLFSNVVADYHTNPDYSIRVRSTDTDNLYFEKQLQITVWPDTLTGTASFEGDILHDMVWSADTVKVTSDIRVTDSATLTILPGCCVEFQGYYKFDIYNGTVIAEGSVEDTIVFTIHDNTGFDDLYNPTGGWQGIIMDDHGQMSDVDTSVFMHCIFEYAKGTSSRSWERGGAFYVDRTGKLRIEDCVIRNNSSHTSGGGIGLGEGAHISLRNSYFYHNRAIDGGGMDVGKVCRVSIEYNVFYKNTALNNGGGIYSNPGAAYVINNIISNNYAGSHGGGIYTFKSFNTFLGNLIVNNEAAQDGGGMLINSCSPDIINNTICYNKADIGSGIMFPYTGTPNIVNSIFWGNSSYDNAQINLGVLGKPDIRYCLLEGGFDSIKMGPDHNYYGIYSENLAADPLFIDPSHNAGLADDGLIAKWGVLGASPCLNSGSNDLAGSMLEFDDVYQDNRLQYAIIDMGAVETNIPEHIAETEITSNTSWIADSIFVNGDIYIRDSATLTISPGAVVVFQGYYGIFNEGVLHAVGTKENMIKFTVYNTDGSSNLWSSSGNWKGITISNSIPGKEGQMWNNDTTRIDYCILEYANSYPINESGGAVRIVNFSKIIISNSILRYNMAQKKGGAINLTAFSDLIIKNNVFHHNRTEGDGGGISIYTNSEPLILNNIISNNTASGGGGGIGVYQADPVIINNIICNNTANAAGNVRLSQSNGVFINNTVVNNRSEGNCGGIWIYNGSPYIINSIIWGNEDMYGKCQIKVNENPSFFNCVIENVSGGGLVPGDFSGILSNILDVDPEFISPSGGVGANFDGLSADWSLSNLSPCVNSGTSEQDISLLPAVDIAGNPRLNGFEYDIGAYEHQGRLPVILSQPAGGTRCVGEAMVLEVECNDSAVYSWKKDGILIPDADGSELVFNPVLSCDQGNYQCIIENRYGTVNSAIVTLFVNELPGFISEPAGRWARDGKETSFTTYYTGSNPGFYWEKDGVSIPGAIAPEMTISNISYTDEGRYRCIISNTCGADTTEEAFLYVAPQLCMITVDSTNGSNLVIWEKQSSAPILAYNVYRESNAAGIYDLIETVPYDNLSVVEDTTSDPNVQAYLYKITAVNEDGTETDIDLCRVHKTIHLLVSINPQLNAIQLEWDKYYGFDYASYEIYRSSDASNFSKVHSISSTLNSWTDTEAPEGDLYYRISITKSDSCYPSGGKKKVGTGPYNHSLSNMDDNKLKTIEENKAPTEIELSMYNINENQPVGSLIGRLRSDDPNPDDIHYYRFIDGEGAEDNVSFALAGDLLISALVFDYEYKNSYSVRIRSTDNGDDKLWFERSFTININDQIIETFVETTDKGSLMVYPNPFTEKTIVCFPNPGNREYLLIIKDITGKTVRLVNDVTAGEIEIQRDGLSPGLYLLELKGEKTYKARLLVR